MNNNYRFRNKNAMNNFINKTQAEEIKNINELLKDDSTELSKIKDFVNNESIVCVAFFPEDRNITNVGEEMQKRFGTRFEFESGEDNI